MEIKLSKKQKSTIEMIDQIEKRFGSGKYFTKAELPGVTQHTLDALINKNIIAYDTFNEIHYYIKVK